MMNHDQTTPSDAGKPLHHSFATVTAIANDVDEDDVLHCETCKAVPLVIFTHDQPGHESDATLFYCADHILNPGAEA